MFRNLTCLGIKHIKKSVTTKRLEKCLCSKHIFYSVHAASQRFHTPAEVPRPRGIHQQFQCRLSGSYKCGISAISLCLKTHLILNKATSYIKHLDDVHLIRFLWIRLALVCQNMNEYIKNKLLNHVVDFQIRLVNFSVSEKSGKEVFNW